MAGWGWGVDIPPLGPAIEASADTQLELRTRCPGARVCLGWATAGFADLAQCGEGNSLEVSLGYQYSLQVLRAGP